MNKVVDFDFDKLECLCLSLDVGGDVDSMDDRLKDRLEKMLTPSKRVSLPNETF